MNIYSYLDTYTHVHMYILRSQLKIETQKNFKDELINDHRYKLRWKKYRMNLTFTCPYFRFLHVNEDDDDHDGGYQRLVGHWLNLYY